MDGFLIFRSIFAGLIVTAGIILGLSMARKTKMIDQHWENFVIPVLGLFAIHLGIWWMWPNFWWLWAAQTGFVLSQMLVVFGIYMFTLGGKTLRLMGRVVAVFGVIILGMNLYNTASQVPYLAEKIAGLEKESGPNNGAELLAKAKEPVSFMAPVIGWSEPVNINYRKFMVDANGVVNVMINGDQNRVKKSTEPDLGDGIDTLQFQSTVPDPVHVKVTLK